MRFNDLLRTVLANAGEGASADITRWRQCMDLLAQYDVSGARSGHAISLQERNVVLAIMEEMRQRVGLDQRVASVAELGSRLRSPALVRFLCQDHPSVVITTVEAVRLTGEDWSAIIPHLGPLARSVLRRRTDLDPMAVVALRQFGEVDLSLPLPEGAVASGDDAAEQPMAPSPVEHSAPEAQPRWPQYDRSSQIGRLVERIERFKQARGGQEPPSAPVPDAVGVGEPDEQAASQQDEAEEAAAHFSFETDSAGVMQVIDGAPRAALRGVSIAAPSVDSRFGVDGATLGAFRHRAAFENARLILPDGVLAGEWRIDGEPHFDRRSGRFLGYTGSARREQRYESPVRSTAEAPQSEWNGLSAASMRQLVHELRTPLNAVQGYSEMIEAEILGPVPEVYREMARTILMDARALIETFDDLDLASRISRGDLAASSAPLDLASTLHSVLGTLNGERAAQIDLHVEAGVPMILADSAHVERLLSHLVRAGLAALGARERLSIQLGRATSPGMVELVIGRPAALQGIDEDELFEHRYLVDDKLPQDGPALGLTFTLRLVKGIVRHLGGVFSISAESFRIRLSALPMSGMGQEHNA